MRSLSGRTTEVEIALPKPDTTQPAPFGVPTSILTWSLMKKYYVKRTVLCIVNR